MRSENVGHLGASTPGRRKAIAGSWQIGIVRLDTAPWTPGSGVTWLCARKGPPEQIRDFSKEFSDRAGAAFSEVNRHYVRFLATASRYAVYGDAPFVNNAHEIETRVSEGRLEIACATGTRDLHVALLVSEKIRG